MAETTNLHEPVRLAHKARELRQQAADLEQLAKALGEQARIIEENELPDAMDEIGVASLTLEDGTVLRIKSVVAGSIPSKYKEQALAWLVAQGHGELIKTDITLTVPRKDREKVPELLQQLQPLGYTLEVGEGVHAQTLAAWVREYLDTDAERTKAGLPALPVLPLDLLGIFIGRKAEFKAPKGVK